MSTQSYLLILAAYLIGSIPFGLIFSFKAGIDIRKEGSKNIGATNVTRTLGKRFGIITLIFDILKGFMPMFAAAYLLSGDPQQDLTVALCGAAAVLGHMFPVYLRFQGGKGVATGLGIFLFLAPLAVLFSIILFLITVWLVGYVSLGSLLSSASIALWLWLLGAPAWKLWLSGFVALMIWLKHHENIKRLLTGKEKSWKNKKESSS